ncbi:chloride channel protein [Telmatospirillum sp.]|uniref:chloride channel protein n=1 Tax=Telmatospirillum sp. TaxID=2079197 RepID=UPI00283ADC87|nr:chloride channel protein [Telmatospirillum sp.]MDR3437063.1 chloride channel protein [Telmatospirillum sp.]
MRFTSDARKERLLRLIRPGANLLVRHRLRGSQGTLIAFCACLGAAVGIVVVALHAAVSWLHIIDFGLPPDHYLSAGLDIELIRLAIVPTLGGILLALLPLLDRRSRHREIVDPIEANALYGGRMSFVDSLRLVAATVISNASGASLGMEAAYSQIGSGLLSSVGQWLRLRRADLRVFVAAGAAAAIAAAFNAPLAGAFYAYELVLGSYSPGALAQVATAALTGTVVMRLTAGAAPIFLVHQPSAGLHPWDYPLFALLGVGAAVIGIATMRAATGCEQALARLKIPPWLRPAIGGALLSLIAVAFPQVLGSGHGGIQLLFDGSALLPPLVLLLLAKLAGSAISIGTGFRGGLFSSSLFLGCLYGASLSQAALFFGPWLASQQDMFLLVGMGAVAASIVGAPVTMVLLVLEVTGDYEVALGVLAGVITAATITRYNFGYSFATWRFHQRGKLIRGAHDVGWVSNLSAGRMARSDAKTVTTDTPLLRLREQVPLGSRSHVYAVDDKGCYAGLIEMAIAHDPDIDDAAAGLVAGDLARGRESFLLPEMDVRAVLTRFEETEKEALPVLAGADDRRIIGYVSEAYALRRYSQELERHHNEQVSERDLFGSGPER